MFTASERLAVFSLASIFIFRMLGLFIIIPIFSPYLQDLTNSTPFLIGMTMGIYGLTQVIFQIPLGILSDHIGRKEVITLGLVIFLIGSLFAASSTNIWFVMLGRGLQGAGAISGTLIALLSDLTSESARTKAMAVIGVSIGGAFIMAFILGPVLNSIISVNSIFYLVAILVLPVIYILWRVTPNVAVKNDYQSESVKINNFGKELFKDKKLFKQLAFYSFSIFSLHGILMANFVAIPIILKTVGLTSWQQAKLYIAVFIPALVLMVPLIIASERKQRQKMIIIIAVILLMMAELIFFLLNNKF